MPSTFPVTLDSFVDPTATSKLNSPSNSTQHTLKNDAIEKIEAKVGVTGSAVITTHDYKLSGVTGTDKAVSKTAEETLLLKTLTTPIIASIYQDAGKTKLMTLPNTASDTLVALAAAQELSGKTLNSPIIKGAAGAAPTAEGNVMFDSTAKQLKYGNGTTTVTVGQQNRAFTWYLDDVYVTSTNKVGTRYIAPQAMTTVKVVYKTDVTNSRIQLYKDATLIGEYEVGTSYGSTNVATAITAGQIISLVVSAVNGAATNLSVTLECTQP